MKAHKTTLPNGLRLITIPMPGMESATVTIWVGVGSRYETKNISGISHFLEHMVFKGGKKYSSAKIISETVDAMGAEFNAGTSKEWTNFYIKTRVGMIDRAFDILSDMVLTPALRDEDINRERGVIISEMNMYEDTPMYKIGDVFDQVAFEGNKLGWDIVGNKETINSINSKDFKDYREKYYRPTNMVVTVSGGIDEKEVIKIAKKYFENLKDEPYKREFDKFTFTESSPKIKLINKPIEQAHFILGFYGSELGNENRYIEEVMAVILGGGMSSRLFTEVREKRGLAYSVRTSVDNFMDTGSIGTYAGVDPKKATEALKVILEGHLNLASGKTKILAEELTKAKEYVKGHLALSLESTNSVGSFFGHDELLLGKMETPEEIFEGIDAVTTEDIVSLAKEKFVKEKLNLSIIGPFEASKDFEKVLQF